MFLEHCWIRNVIMSEVSSPTHSGSFIASGMLWLEKCMALKPKVIEFLATLWRRMSESNGSLISTFLLFKCKWHVSASCKWCCLSHIVTGCCCKMHFHWILHSGLICEIIFKPWIQLNINFKNRQPSDIPHNGNKPTNTFSNSTFRIWKHIETFFCI